MANSAQIEKCTDLQLQVASLQAQLDQQTALLASILAADASRDLRRFKTAVPLPELLFELVEDEVADVPPCSSSDVVGVAASPQVPGPAEGSWACFFIGEVDASAASTDGKVASAVGCC